MSRKCFSSVPSSFASIYLITIFFVISFISLLYFKYPQQYINYIDFRIIKVNNTTTRTTTNTLLTNEVFVPSNGVLKEVLSPVEIPTTLSKLQQPLPPVVNNAAMNSPVDKFSPSVVNISDVYSPVEEISVPSDVNNLAVSSPVVNNPAVNSPVDELAAPYDVNNSAVSSPDVNNPAVNSPVDELESPPDVNNTAVSSPDVNNPSENSRVDEPESPPDVNNPAVNSPVDQLAPSPELSPPSGVKNSSVYPPDEQLLAPSDVNIPAANTPVDQLTPPPSVNSPVNNAINSTTTTTPKAIDDSEVKKRYQISPDNSLTTEEGSASADEKQNNVTDDEDEDEASVIRYDHISYPPINFTREERMEWVKQRIPESKILESTPRTRKFELKMQQFVHTKHCSVKIFMTWISSMGFIGKREMLSIESVLKAHPHACVIIISRIMATKTGLQVIQPLIDRGFNINAIAPDYPLLFNGTPAQDWFERLKTGQIDPGQISLIESLSNLVRVLVLYKYGGIYLDTDMIILKDISTLRNTIAVQDIDPETSTWRSVNNAVLIFDKGHPLLLRFIEEFNSNYDGNAWGHNGPYLATRVIRKYLHDSNYQFNMMSSMAFYPIGWNDVHKIFRTQNANELIWVNDMLRKVSKESYGVHLWNKYSHNLRIEKGCIIAKLVLKNCIICQDIYGS